MLERAVYPVIGLEIRQRRGGGRTLRGSFPYGKTATLRDRGRVRKESFGKRAFNYSVKNRRQVHLLRGHNYDSPLADIESDTLELFDNDDALEFRAKLPKATDQPSWIQDTVKGVNAGLIRGVSPGFRVPPASAIGQAAEELIPEPGNPGVQIRVIRQAVLYELSLVARPAYDETTLDLRSFSRDRNERIRRIWL